MAQALTLEDGIGRKELDAIRRRFSTLQNARLQRILDDLPSRQRILVRLLPLLFHINHPLLPGFVSTETASGIDGYHPSRDTLDAAQHLSHTFRYRRQALKRPLIHALYLISGNGSIGESHPQRLDLWLCHAPEVDATALDELKQKCARIGEWGHELQMEVRIRTLHPAELRDARQPALPLPETFYRNGLLLAGRPPLWWFVPPEHDAEYDDYTRMLIEHRFVSPEDCLDFGSLESCPPEALFHTALQALDTAVDRPYEALPELLLASTWLRDAPHPQWPARDMKRAVYSGDGQVDDLDPSLLLYRCLETQLEALGQPHRLELLRRALYFRSGVRLSQPGRRGWREDTMAALVQSWGWDGRRLALLDARPHWKIHRVLGEHNNLGQEISNGYRLLQAFARTLDDRQGTARRRLGLLGRRLYTTLEQRRGKVDLINPGISGNLHAPELTLAPGEDDLWRLYPGKLDGDQVTDATPLRVFTGLIETLAWCHLNTVASSKTRFVIRPPERGPGATELHALQRTLAEILPTPNGGGNTAAELEQPPHLCACALFVNIGHDPMETLVREDKQLTSNRCDPLSFSSSHTNLVHSLEQLTLTSWGEWLVRRYEGTEGLLDALCNTLTTLDPRADAPSPRISAHCFSSLKGPLIGQRVTALFTQAAAAFMRDSGSRFVCEIGDAFYLIQWGGRGHFWLRFHQLEELLDDLREPAHRPAPLVLSTPLPDDSPLQALVLR